MKYTQLRHYGRQNNGKIFPELEAATPYRYTLQCRREVKTH